MVTAPELQHKVPFLDLAAQYSTLASEMDEAISRVLQDCNFILGREVELFEKEFAAFCGAGYAIGVDCGMSALELALRAYKIGPGDEVITVANSFIASALAISHTGATPVLVDADPQTYTIDVSGIQAAITPRSKAIMPVHLYGQPCDMDPITKIAEQYGLTVIEDACQAHGAKYKGRRAGSLGHAAAFSFYPSKNLGAYGDGGIVVTSDNHVAENVRVLRNYGQEEKYQHVVPGYNRRLDTLQAAVLRIKLCHLDGWNEARRRHAKLYQRLLAGTDVVTPIEASYAEPVWHLYVIRAAQRNALAKHLATLGITSGMHYPIPIHLQPAYRDLGYKKGDFPVTEEYAQRILSIPMYPELAECAVRYVAESIQKFVSTMPCGSIQTQTFCNAIGGTGTLQ
jgi:dTDP-4-amino-4,6-dideoxygalactose transaminase